MAIIYLSNDNFTCPIVQTSLYLSVLKHADISTLVNSVNADQLASEAS